MKKLFNKIIAGAGVAVACITLAPSAPAQTAIAAKTYPVAPFQNTNLTTLKTYTNLTVTFPIFRGRGFSFHTGIFSTNMQAGSNLTAFVFQFSTPHTNAVYGTLVTNWESASPLTFTAPMSTNQPYWGTNISATTVDNYTLGRLTYISNAITSDVTVNLTNTYVGINP